MWKKAVMGMAVAAAALTMSACGGASQGSGSSSGTAVPQGKSIVVYYSASGHTKQAAETIAKETGSDLFAITPKVPYTEADLDYNNRDSRVYREHDDASLRDIPLVKDKADNWEGYDTVFIGYPIWWGIAAWPVDTFVKHNDFSGKTVIPFATSASSGLGNSGRQLQQMAGTGNWLEGKRFPSNVSESTVQQWVQSFNL